MVIFFTFLLYTKDMLHLSVSLQNLPLGSLRVGSIVGEAVSPIINPHNLKVEGWHALLQNSNTPRIVTVTDIRDFSTKGIVINDAHDLLEPKEHIRLQKVLRLEYRLVNKPVYAGKSRIGKVSDYAVDSDTFFITKLYVRPSLFKGLAGGQQVVDRSQVVKLTHNAVFLKEPLKKEPVAFGIKLQKLPS